MHFKKSILFFLIFVCQLLSAQNLVPNPGFENYSSCPTDILEGKYSNTNALENWDYFFLSPDYYHSCNQGNASIPTNMAGNQTNVQGGNGYVGMVLGISEQTDAREGIFTELTEELEIGKEYFCSFHASLAESSAYAINKIGLRFSNNVQQLNYFPSEYILPGNSQIFTDEIISDTSNWVFVSGSFVADSAYQYISISNHFNDTETSIEAIDFNIPFYYSYYYIDNICVSSNPSNCVEKTTANLNLSSSKQKLKIYPNPNTHVCHIELPETQNKIKINIINLNGQVLISETKENCKKATIDTSNLAPGIYMAEVKENEKFHYSKIIKK